LSDSDLLKRFADKLVELVKGLVFHVLHNKVEQTVHDTYNNLKIYNDICTQRGQTGSERGVTKERDPEMDRYSGRYTLQ